MNGFWNWNDFLRQIYIAPAPKKHRKPRSHRYEALEPRAMLTNYTVSIKGESDAGPGVTGGFTLTMSPALAAGDAYAYYDLGGSAAEPIEGYYSTGSVLFTAGESIATLPVTGYDGDGDAPETEQMTMTLTSVGVSDGSYYDTGSVGSTATRSITVTEGTAAGGVGLAVSFNPDSAAESSTFTADVTISGLTAPTLLQWSDSTTDQGSDVYNNDLTDEATSGSVTSVTNYYTYALDLPTHDDGMVETGGQSLTVTVTVDGVTQTATAEITEPDNDNASPTISIGDATQTEPADGVDTMPFAVTISPPPTAATSVDFSTVDGTGPNAATQPEDYVSTSGVLSFTSGQTTADYVNVKINADAYYPGAETFSVTLSNPSAAAVLGTRIGTGTINQGSTQLRITDASAIEGASSTSGTLTFTASLSSPSDGVVSFDWETEDGNASQRVAAATHGVDYVSAQGAIAFPPGSVGPMTFEVVTKDDELANEPFTETLSISVYNVAGVSAPAASPVGRIVEDDDDADPPVMTIDDASITEPSSGYANMAFTVHLSEKSAEPVTLGYDVSDGSASQAEGDYAQGPANGLARVVMPALETETTIAVQVYADAWEPTNPEDFYVTLASPYIGTSPGTPRVATGTIWQLPEPSVTVSSPTANETSGEMPFTLSLSTFTNNQPVKVVYKTVDGSADSLYDYIGTTQATATIPAGQTTALIDVTLLDDDAYMTNEPRSQSFTVSLLSVAATNVTLGSNRTGTGTITEDDDPLPTIYISNAAASEKAGTMIFAVVLSPPSAAEVDVPYLTSDETAEQGTDYGYASGTVVFPSGSTLQYIDVSVLDDTTFDDPPAVASSTDKNTKVTAKPEPMSDFSVNLYAPANANYNLQWPNGTGYIYDGAVPKNLALNCVCTCSCPGPELTPTKANGNAPIKNSSGDAAGTATQINRIPNKQPHPVVSVQDVLGSHVAGIAGVTGSGATDVRVDLTFGPIIESPIYYSPSGYTAGQTVDFAEQVDAGALSPGLYGWTMNITEEYANAALDVTRTYNGSYDVQNLDKSHFGAGWMLNAVDQLYPTTGGVELADGTGNMYYYATNGDTTFTSPPDAPNFATLQKNPDGSYALIDAQGNTENFNSAGYLTNKVDTNGNTTSYQFSGGLLENIIDQEGRTTTFSYETVGSLTLVSSVTDVEGRTTTYGYDTEGDLTSIVEPDPGHGEAQLSVTLDYVTAGASAAAELATMVESDGATHYTYSYGYDPYGALTSVTDPEGHVTRYDAPQDQAFPTTGAGTSQNPYSLVYDSKIRGTEVDADGHSMTYGTDIDGEVTSSTDASGAVTITAYNAAGEPLEIIGPELTSGPDASVANFTLLQYDSYGNTIREIQPDDSTQYWVYDVDVSGGTHFNEPVSYTDPEGRVTLWTLDASTGNVLSMTEVGVDSPDRVTKYTYTPKPSGQGQVPGGLLSTEIDPRGIETDYFYNTHGLVTKVVQAANSTAPTTVSYGFNSVTDDLQSETDELNRTTLFHTDGLGRTIETDSPPPTASITGVYPVSYATYDVFDRLLSETDVVSEQPATVELVTDYSYEPGNDDDAALIDQEATYGVTISAGVTTTTTYSIATHGYDRADNQTSYIDGMGHTTLWQVDSLNRQVAEHDPNPAGGNNGSFRYGTADGPLTSLVYDQLGNVVQAFDAKQNRTDNAYDLRGDLLSTTGPAPTSGGTRPVTSYTYNRDQQITSETDSRGAVTQLFYNEFGELIKRVDPSPSAPGTPSPAPAPVTTFQYDPDGNRVAEVDPNGGRTQFIYNSLNELVEQIGPSPDGGATRGPTTQWLYDPAGQVTATFDPMNRETQFVFDGDGNLIQTIAPDLVTGSSGGLSTTTTDSYNLAGDKLTEISPTPGGNTTSPTTTWRYNALGEVTAEIDPSPDGITAGPTWQYFYNADQQVTETIDPLGRTEASSFDALGRATQTVDFTGVTTDDNFDLLSELLSSTVGAGTSLAQATSHAYDNLGRETLTTAANGATTAYSFDLEGNQTSLVDSDGNATSWEFDYLNRPIRENTPTGTNTYQYDQNGNLLRTVDADGRVIQDQYDALNRQTSEIWLSGAAAAVSVVTPGVGGQTDDVQSIIVEHGVSSGTWTLSYNSVDSGGIPYDATANEVQTELDEIPALDGNVTVSGSGTSTDPFLVTFDGKLAAQSVSVLVPDWSGLYGGADYDQSDIGVSNVTTGQPGTNQSEAIGYADAYSQPVDNGDYRLAFGGQWTDTIAAYATAGDMQKALEALPNIGAGNVLVTGGASENPIDFNGAAAYQVTFVGALGGQPQPAITVVDNLLLDESNYFVPTFAAVTTPGVAAIDEVQQMQVIQPSGTFTLSLSGATVAVAVGSTDEELAADLASLPAIGSTANVSVSGSGTAADPYEVTFMGALAGESVPALTVVGATEGNAIHTSYNADGTIASIGDDFSDYTYGYDGQGNVASVDNRGSPNMPRVQLFGGYDAAGNRASLGAIIDGTPDFVNSYSYDELSRLTDIMQQGVTGGNAVAQKQVYYTLDSIGDVTGIDRSNSTSPGPEVTGPGYSTLTYNPQALLSAIDHLHDGTQLENMIYTYDALDRVSTFQSNDGTATYGYDSVNEVTSANYTTASGGHQPADETYSFDLNGNRPAQNSGTVVNNEVSDDGTFKYTFDADGNRLTRQRDILSAPQNDDLVSYTWDARNRLTGVEDFSWNAASSALVETEAITYTYDVFDHLIERLDNVIGTGTTTTQYVWDGDNVVLSFDNGVLAARYLNGPNTSASDQYFSTLAEENVSTGVTNWDLLDAQGSLRDVIDSNGNVIDHLNYNSFGQKIYESAPSVSHIDGYAGGLYDPSTQLLYFIHRWYDPAATVWISADPAGFAAGDANLTRYVGNNPANMSDANGLYGRDGHFWTTYMIALAAGKSAGLDSEAAEARAYKLAYYSQLPDQVRRFEAVSVAKAAAAATAAYSASIAHGGSPQSDLYQRMKALTAWGKSVFNALHSLHCGGAEAIQRRRSQLSRLITTGVDGNGKRLSDVQLGFIIHAFGDAFAHTQLTSRGPQSFCWPTGHGDLTDGYGGHAPDIIALHREKYKTYVRELYAALGGVGNPGDNTLIMELLGFADRISDLKDGETAAVQMMLFARQYAGYKRSYIPTDNFNVDTNMSMPSEAEVANVMKVITGANAAP